MANSYPTCVTWSTAALITVHDVGTRGAVKTRTGRTFIHFRFAQPARISGRACAHVTSGSDRQRVTGGRVLARRRQAAVHLAEAPTSGVAHCACAPERIDEVDARAAICAKCCSTFVDVCLTAITAESRWTPTPVRAHLRPPKHTKPVNSFSTQRFHAV